MKYNVFYKGHTYSYNYDPRYEPMDFIRNNEDINFFMVEDWKPKINMDAVISIMIECYRQMLEQNYL